MVETMATATEMKNQFGKYLQMVMEGNEVIITRNGKEIARLVPKDRVITSITESLTGVLQSDYDLDDARSSSLRDKYEIND